jgi:hypothetical protein
MVIPMRARYRDHATSGGSFMRFMALAPLLVIAACSDGAAPTKQDSDAPAAEQLSAGQWEMTSEVTKLTQRDKGTPAIKAPQGSKSTSSSCVAEADVKKPQPALFAPEGSECSYRDLYMSGGRLNATLACSRAGLGGTINTNVNGSFTATTFEGNATSETSLSGDGDVRIDAKLTGRRTGECSAAPAKG